jgi:hypothetical protein
LRILRSQREVVHHVPYARQRQALAKEFVKRTCLGSNPVAPVARRRTVDHGAYLALRGREHRIGTSTPGTWYGVD